MQQSHRLQSLLIRKVTRLAILRPVAVVVTAVLLAAGCVGIMIQRLEFRTNRADLLHPGSDFQQDWLQYANRFDAADDVVVVVEGSNPIRVFRVMDELGAQLDDHPDLFRNIHYRFDSRDLMQKGLHYLSVEELDSLDQLVSRLVPMLQASAQSNTVRNAHWWQLVKQTSEAPDQFQSPWPFAALKRNLEARLPEYSLAGEGKLGIISLHLVTASPAFAQGSQPIQQLRRIAQQTSSHHSDVRIGVTGLPVIEYDEMSTSQHDMTMASVVTLCLVAILFWAGFGDLRYPAFAIIALLIGIMWTCGYLTLTLGHLNILSMSFGVILIGLGVDFAIHYVARYLAIRQPNEDSAAALMRTSLGVGPAIFAGGLTTALAFFATGLTEFLGVAELGIIAGGGILLCVFATLLVLPALLRLDRRRHRPSRRGAHSYWYGVLRPRWNHPKQTVVWGLVITGLLAIGISRLRYDHNLLNLQAAGLESVTWEHHLLTNTDRSVWYAVSTVENRQELDERRRQFAALDSVERVEDMTELIPATSAKKRALIHRISRRLDSIGTQAPALPPLDAAQLPTELAQGAALASDPAIHQQSETEQIRRINLARTIVATDLWQQLRTLRTISSPHEPTLADLPDGLRARFVGHHDAQLLRVFARGNVWDPVALERFVKQVKAVDPTATGQPLQNYYGSRQMQRSYLHAAAYSACAVFLVLWWDLRRLKLVLLATTPTALAIVQLFGVMGLLQIPLNPANIIVLPLIVGIGIDDGIHVVHDRRHSVGRVSLLPATTNGIIMTSLTSMIGFGSLMLAQHEGLRSLGRVVTLGITCCLLTSIVWLPCVLSLLPARGVRPGNNPRLRHPNNSPVASSRSA